MKKRLEGFKKLLESNKYLEEFDRAVFERIVDKIIIGGTNDEGEIDPAIITIISNSKVMQYLEAPYTKEHTEQFLFRSGLSDTPLIYAVEKDDDFIGYVIYHDYDSESVEIG